MNGFLTSRRRVWADWLGGAGIPAQKKDAEDRAGKQEDGSPRTREEKAAAFSNLGSPDEGIGNAQYDPKSVSGQPRPRAAHW